MAAIEELNVSGDDMDSIRDSGRRERVRGGDGAPFEIIGSGVLRPVGCSAQKGIVEEESNPELRDMTIRFWISAVLTLPVLAVAMRDLIPGDLIEGLASPRNLTWIEFAFATPVVLWGGWPFFVRAWSSIVNKCISLDLDRQSK